MAPGDRARELVIVAMSGFGEFPPAQRQHVGSLDFISVNCLMLAYQICVEESHPQWRNRSRWWVMVKFVLFKNSNAWLYFARSLESSDEPKLVPTQPEFPDKHVNSSSPAA